MAQLARDTGLSREGLYKALSKDGNPATHPGRMAEAGRRILEAEPELTPEVLLDALSEGEEG